MPPVSSSPAPPPRRARRRPARPHWERFAVAVGLTAALVLLFGAGPFELSGGATPDTETAAAVHTVADDTGTGPTTTSAAPTTTSSTTTSTTTTTTVPPTTTTTTPKLRVPGLGLPPQPAPTPVSLPPTNSSQQKILRQ